MLKYFAENWMGIATNLEILRWQCIAAALPIGFSADQAQQLVQGANVDELLTGLQQEAAELPLSLSLRRQIERFVEAIRKLDPASQQALHVVDTLCNELKFNLHAELESQLFLLVEPTRAALHTEPEKWFGETTISQFQGISRDVRDACRCFALEQWTAAVFHATRILERGLHAMAAHVKITLDPSIENWKNVIEQIEKEIRLLEQRLPRGQQKSAELQFLSEAAVQFSHFKEAWRNHVSHVRGDYDEEAARVVLNATKYFMAALAKRPAQP